MSVKIFFQKSYNERRIVVIEILRFPTSIDTISVMGRSIVSKGL